MAKREKQGTRDIYILLVRTQSLFSRVIHTATREEYTHVSVGMLSDCTELYSFARRYTNLPLPAGFVKESIDSGLMAKSKTAPCALYRLTVPVSSYHALRRRFKKMLRKRKHFHYSIIGTFLCFFGIAYKRENRYFCSQFVAEVLKEAGAVRLTKSPELFHPVDFTTLPEMKLCYKGTLGELGHVRHCLPLGNC
ncbi:MAG: hypothetical protein ACI4QX_05010 [Lachnospiraceae bacterium]